MSRALVWFRRDLRCIDNPALATACKEHQEIIPLFIYEDGALELGDAQKWWLHHSLQMLDSALATLGMKLILQRGAALTLLPQLIETWKIDAVYWNRCYEPLAIARDSELKKIITEQNRTVLSFNGSLLFEPWTIRTKQDGNFKVFTPFWRQCQQQLNPPAPYLIHEKKSTPQLASESLETWELLPKKPNWAIGFSKDWQPGEEGALAKLQHFIDDALTAYNHDRDYPAKAATSKLSPHLHFGEISSWGIVRAIEPLRNDSSYSQQSIERFLAELGWREFSYHLLYHYPDFPQANFRQEFNQFPWVDNEIDLQAWQKGLTGFPIVDAGMRELWQTGWMHNRVRMIVASFLVKDLFIDWRQGAAWFMNTLLDADLANNSAGWQWVAGSGADAAPYFRIFNPMLQSEKFDPQGCYIKKWIPELAKLDAKWIHQPWLAPKTQVAYGYPAPLVDHHKARDLALQYYKRLKNDE